MSENKSLRDQAIKQTFDKTALDLEHNYLMIEWYDHLIAIETDKKMKADHELKRQQLLKAKDLNQKFLEFFAGKMKEISKPKE